MKRSAYVLALAALAPAGYAQVALATNGTDLYSVDLPTATATLIGSFGVNVFMESLARNETTNELFSADSTGNLYSVDSTTGVATLIGNTGIGNIEGLDFAGNILYGTDFSTTPSIFVIDTGTAFANAFVQSNTATGFVRTMAFDSSFTNAYMLGDNPGPQGLYAMLSNGSTTLVGTVQPFIAAMENMGNDDFWALGVDGTVYQLNIATAGLTRIGDTGNQFWVGMTTANPVPEPASLAAITLGTIAVLRRRKA